MKEMLRKVAAFLSSPPGFALFLLAVCLAAYAPMINKLGFYWDDFPMNWIATTMGGAGLERYFSTNRPVWGLAYRITTFLLGSRPITWQIFALVMRWVTGLLLYWLLRLLWPARQSSPEAQERGFFAASAAVLFVVYPGFSQQFIAFLYSHFFIVLSAYLLSLCLMIQAQRDPRRRVLLTAISLLLGLFNLLAMEYFFLLDLLRPLLLFIAMDETVPNRRERVKRALLAWLPYLLVFAGAMYWRSVLFGFQTYQPALMSRMKAAPIQAVLALLPTMFTDIWVTSAGAWAKAFQLPNVLEVGARNIQRYWIFVAVSASAAVIYWLIFYFAAFRMERSSQSLDHPKISAAGWLSHHGWAWQPLAIGISALVIAGGPFWLTDLQIGLVFSNDRFTLPFMLGASLLVAALLSLLPIPGWVKIGLLSVGLGFAVGTQYQNAIVYNRDWSVQRSMFWQMTWRMPGIQPGTALLSNELPVIHYTDNSLTAPLNWTFDPHNDPLTMKYVLLYPTLRKEALLSNFQNNQPITLDYLAATFTGNTAQVVTFYFNPPGCLRVMDPEVEKLNWMIPAYLKESLDISSTTPILTTAPEGTTAARPPEQIFGAEIPHGWCYAFEKADLARQAGDWKTVAALGDEAFAAKDYPNDPLERFPFIEGYAHVGNWQRAIDLSREASKISPVVMQPMVCRLWERIDRQTQDEPQKEKALQTIQAELECTFSDQ